MTASRQTSREKIVPAENNDIGTWGAECREAQQNAVTTALPAMASLRLGGR
jgi:hypothetical protein